MSEATVKRAGQFAEAVEAHDLLLGRRYNRTKKNHGSEAGTNRRDDIAKDQNEPLQSTAARLAVEHGVSEATVKRAGQFAEAVEAHDLLLGRRYNRTKRANGGDRKSDESLAQNDPVISTAARLAVEHGVSIIRLLYGFAYRFPLGF